MSLPTFNLPLLWLQSNHFVAQAIESGAGLQPDYASYKGFTGYFAVLFLFLVHFWAGTLDSFGWAILLTAITVRILLLPLTIQQIRGMKMMQMLQPVQKEITRYYPNKADQNAKMMELYQEYKINPLAGCLPLLIQFPILIGVYRALYDPSFAGHSFFGLQLLFPVSLTSAQGFGHGPAMPDLIDVTIATLNLHSQVWHIPEKVPLIGGGYWYLPALFLVVLYAGSSLLMQRTMKQANKPDPAFEEEFKVEMKSDGGPQQPDFAAQMQRQMGLMNVMILFIAFIFSTGALIYFVAQNLLMSLEYKLLAGRGGKTFDAKELKAFIRRPPPPLAQLQQNQRGGAKPAAGEPKAASPAGAVAGEQSGNPEGGASAAGTNPGQPSRKKKRKK